MDFSSKNELSEVAAALGPISRRAQSLGIPWMLIGAASRDILMRCIYGLPATRATFDVDVAIQVGSWKAYTSLRDSLIQFDNAKAHATMKQRISFPAGDQVDIVPFGGIEEQGRIAWPPESDPVLDVRGLGEALRGSMEVILPGLLIVRIPSVESYLCLKFLAWHNRHLHKPKHDSVDIADVLMNADQLIGMEAMYEDHAAALEQSDYDHGCAVLQVMGARLAERLNPETKRGLIEILERETDESGRLELMREFGGGSNWARLLGSLLRGLA